MIVYVITIRITPQPIPKHWLSNKAHLRQNMCNAIHGGRLAHGAQHVNAFTCFWAAVLAASQHYCTYRIFSHSWPVRKAMQNVIQRAPKLIDVTAERYGRRTVDLVRQQYTTNCLQHEAPASQLSMLACDM